MKRCTTTLFSFLFVLAVTSSAFGQITDVTIRDINAIDGDSILALNALGANLTAGDIPSKIFNDLVSDSVRFTAVVMSDPANSGLSTPDANGEPSRVHYFVRDTSAVSQGNDGMGIQIVDGAWRDTGSLNLLPGDVVEMVGTVGPFGTTMQIAPITINNLGNY